MDPVARPEENLRARRYGTLSRRVALASMALSLAFLLLLWSSRLVDRLWKLLDTALPEPFATLLLLAVVNLLIAVALLPTRYLGDLLLPRHFDLSHQSSGDWLRDWAKATGLGVTLGVLVGAAFYGSIDLWDGAWWLAFLVVVTLGTLLLAFVFPYVVLPLFFRLRPLEDPELVAEIQSMFRRAGSELAEIVTLDFSRRGRRANAAVVGLGRSRRVVLTDTLLATFSLPEIVGVVAHELGHHVLGHLGKLIAAQVAVMSVGVGLAAVGAQSALRLAAGATLADRGALPLVLLGAEVYLLLASPLSAALSRRLEREADRFACRLTGQPGAFAAALRRLGSVNLIEWQPPRWAVWLFGTHPPLAERVGAAIGFERA